MRSIKSLSCGLCCAIFVGLFFLTLPSTLPAQTNPCAPKAKKASQNPCAVNPCAVKNPCAVNPCAPGGQAAGPSGKAVTVRGEVVKVDPNSRKLVLKADGRQLDLVIDRHAVVREGPQVKSAKEIKPGEKVTVSYVESGKDRTAWYIYLASAAPVGNPCAANPCAVKNPCAAKQPCAPKAKKAAKNPCAANPCAVKNPCAPKAKGK
ncbi:MAG: hypothetical protein HY694_02115 [Deltaproteobacteria bacterium]|nr:hypothetical protein [Deltaproteobacteria bacterium]